MGYSVRDLLIAAPNDFGIEQEREIILEDFKKLGLDFFDITGKEVVDDYTGERLIDEWTFKVSDLRSGEL